MCTGYYEQTVRASPRSFRNRSTIIRFSARSFTLAASHSASATSAGHPRGRARQILLPRHETKFDHRGRGFKLHWMTFDDMGREIVLHGMSFDVMGRGFKLHWMTWRAAYVRPYPGAGAAARFP